MDEVKVFTFALPVSYPIERRHPLGLLRGPECLPPGLGRTPKAWPVYVIWAVRLCPSSRSTD